MHETIITISGNIVNEPIVRQLESGATLLTFRVASNSRKYDSIANDWIDGSTLYMSVSCWGQLAVKSAGVLTKGKAVIVTGALKTTEYINADGLRRSNTELRAQEIGVHVRHLESVRADFAFADEEDEELAQVHSLGLVEPLGELALESVPAPASKSRTSRAAAA